MGRLAQAINKAQEYYSSGTTRTAVDAAIAAAKSSNTWDDLAISAVGSSRQEVLAFDRFLRGLSPIPASNRLDFLNRVEGSAAGRAMIQAYESGQISEAQLGSTMSTLMTAYNNRGSNRQWNNLISASPTEASAVIAGIRAGRGNAVLSDLASDGDIDPARRASPPPAPPPAPNRRTSPPPPPAGRRSDPVPDQDTASPTSPPAAPAAPDPEPVAAAAAPTNLTGPLSTPRTGDGYTREQRQGFEQAGTAEKTTLQQEITQALGGDASAAAAAARIVGELDATRLGNAMGDPRYAAQKAEWLEGLGNVTQREMIIGDATARPGAFGNALLSGQAGAQLEGRMTGYQAFNGLADLTGPLLEEVANPENPLHRYQSQLQQGFAALQHDEGARSAFLDAAQQGGPAFTNNMARFQEIMRTGQMGGQPVSQEHMDVIMNSFAEDPAKWVRVFGQPEDQFESALRRTAMLEIGGNQLGIDFGNIGNWMQGMMQGLMDWLRETIGPMLEGFGINLDSLGLTGQNRQQPGADAAAPANGGPAASAAAPGARPPGAGDTRIVGQVNPSNDNPQLAGGDSAAPRPVVLTDASGMPVTGAGLVPPDQQNQQLAGGAAVGGPPAAGIGVG